MSRRLISRRTMLRGAGVAMALPWLECMGVLPAAKAAAAGAASGGASGGPLRSAFIYIPNGVIEEDWLPKKTGAGFDLPPSLEPLAAHKSRLNVLSHLDRTFVGGTGVHAQAGACWLTSSPPSEALDGGFPTNVSLDQMIARRQRGQTMLPSLELSCNDHADNKETKYFESISWYGPGYAANVEKDPRAVFNRLFRSPGGDAVSRSVLDVVLADAKSLRGRLGRGDQQKLDEYLDSVRATEQRIEQAEQAVARMERPPIPEPGGIPEHRGQYIRLMGELMVLAFQLDLTRVATIVIDPERWDSPRMYHGVFDKPANHHVLTHTKGDAAREQLRKIDRFHVEQFATILDRMAATPEGDGTLLDNSMIALGSGLSDGRVHDYGDLSVVLAGGAGGRIETGRHLAYPKGTPLANLWLSLLGVTGVEQDRFADSTGELPGLGKPA